MIHPVNLVSNNGTVGGGEVMLVALAECLRDLGAQVRVVVPRMPEGAYQLASDRDLDVLAITAHDRRSYLVNLASHRRQLEGEVWWCNGLVPAVALAGARHRRVVTLHQAPTGNQRRLWMVARRGVERVYVPSASMRSRIPGAAVLTNWTDELSLVKRPMACPDRPIRIGFIGRFSPIKGLDVLARAVQRIERTGDHDIELVLAGDDRLVPDGETARVHEALRGVSKIIQLGWVQREAFFSQVDVVVVPSVWEEPFGLVAAEAMALGCPVIVSDAGALCEVVGPDHPWVTKAGDVADTVKVLRKFFVTDPEVIAAHCAQARVRWEREFSPAAGRSRVAVVATELGLIDPVASAPN